MMQCSSVPLYHAWTVYGEISIFPLSCKTHLALIFQFSDFYPFYSNYTELSSILWFHWLFKLAYDITVME